MVKTKRSAQDVVYDVLAELPIGMALTSNEIYNELEPADQGMFVGGVSGVMKSIYKLSERGIVTNGNSEIVNGRTVKTWRLTVNEVSTHKPMVNAVSETVEAEENVVQEEKVLDVVRGEKILDDNEEYSIETLIQDAQNTVLLSIASVFSGLIDAVEKNDYSKPVYDANHVDSLINGLFDVTELLAEKIAVEKIIPTIEFLRGLK